MQVVELFKDILGLGVWLGWHTDYKITLVSFNDKLNVNRNLIWNIRVKVCLIFILSDDVKCESVAYRSLSSMFYFV